MKVLDMHVVIWKSQTSTFGKSNLISQISQVKFYLLISIVPFNKRIRRVRIRILQIIKTNFYYFSITLLLLSFSTILNYLLPLYQVGSHINAKLQKIQLMLYSNVISKAYVNLTFSQIIILCVNRPTISLARKGLHFLVQLIRSLLMKKIVLPMITFVSNC